MISRNVGRALFLAAIALNFGINSLRYSTGTFSHAGPGLFPLMVSSLLLLIAVVMIVGARFGERTPLDFSAKNIALLIGSLCSFALLSKLLNMSVGIAAMVFIAALAGKATYSVSRNLKVAAGLIAVAFAFQKLLGLNLPLY